MPIWSPSREATLPSSTSTTTGTPLIARASSSSTCVPGSRSTTTWPLSGARTATPPTESRDPRAQRHVQVLHRARPLSTSPGRVNLRIRQAHPVGAGGRQVDQRVDDLLTGDLGMTLPPGGERAYGQGDELDERG